MFNVVLVEPEIPANTGNIARSCVAAGARLHLVGPLGFSLDDRALRRAGMDYWREVDVAMWGSFAEYERSAPDAARVFLLSTKGARAYSAEAFRPGDSFVFGRETRGLPEALLAAAPDRVLTIPMAPGARSLNLAVAAGVVLFEALRQCGGPRAAAAR